MGRYIVRRLLLIFPTLIGIITLNFFIVQLAPGGPVDQMIATLTGQNNSAAGRVAGAVSGPQAVDMTGNMKSQYAGAQGLDPELIKAIEKQFGFDKPIHVRYFMMLRDYLTLDLGNSSYQGRPVLDLIRERLPVSMSIGLWSMLLIYFISIPLGVAKGGRD